jgi:VanZ family protein
MELIPKKAWLVLTVAWAATIFSLSRAAYSAATSASFLSTGLDWLYLSSHPQDLALLNALFRKSSHLAEYAILAVLLYNCLKPVANPFWSPRAAYWALVVSGCYSMTDELHQYFVPGRHASLSDCLIDTTGALLGLWVLSKAMAGVRRRLTDSWDSF